MKKLKALLLTISCSVFTFTSFAQFEGRGQTISVTHNIGYPTCDYTVSVSAEVKSYSTGITAMTMDVTQALSPGQTKNFTFYNPSGQYLTGRYRFYLQPNNGGTCAIVIDYTSSSTPGSIYSCSCSGPAASEATIWQKTSSSSFEFVTTQGTGM